MYRLENLPDILRHPDARFVHRFRIFWSDTELWGAAAWFDWAGVQEKLIRSCLFDVPTRIPGDISVFAPLLGSTLNDWVPLMLSHNEHFRPAINVARHTFKKTSAEAGTLIFDQGGLSTLRSDPGICAHLSHHHKLKLLANPDILLIR